MMEALLEFAKGPLFAATFSFMVLGLLRRAITQLAQLRTSLRRLARADIDVGANVRQSLAWLLPVKHLYRNRPFVSFTSFAFHVGLLVVPIFLLNHIDLWKRALGVAWPGISAGMADTLTIMTIVAALVLLGFRILDRAGRTLSSPLDYFLLVALLVPFASGFMAFHPQFNPLGYTGMMLLHVLSAELLFVLIPTTKLAHSVLFFFDRFSSDIFWKMPVGAGDRVAQELHGEERRV
jgi:nitrate reductase gamma subunit